ncbi:MAG: YbaB/EbfC family nucleoid-associated protein [Clostridia bacterium]|nr:YbaB/EbfC family nucleoid-associated protein [Clostridia bacterium]
MARQHTGFPGIGGNMQQLMRQAQKAQQDVAQAQEEIGEKIFEVSVGGGAVKVTLNGKKEFQSITVSPECVDPDDVETLQDLILAAVNEAVKTADDAMAEAISKATGGLNLGMLGM